MIIKIEDRKELVGFVNPDVYANDDALYILWELLNQNEVTREELERWVVKPVWEFLNEMVERASADRLKGVFEDILEWDNSYEQVIADMLTLADRNFYPLTNGTGIVKKDTLLLYEYTGE